MTGKERKDGEKKKEGKIKRGFLAGLFFSATFAAKLLSSCKREKNKRERG